MLGLALGLRLLGLQRNELSFDEAFSALVASASPTEILAELNNDSSPPLYYLLLYLWRAVAGSGPAALRGLSVLCGVTAVFLAYRLGRRLWGADVAWLGALLLAVSPLHIYYSQQVRPYALFVLLALGSLLLFFTLNREDFSFVIHLDRQPRTSRRREAQTGSRARSGSRSERTLDAVEHSRTLMEWWPFLIFHRGGLRIKVINNTCHASSG